jgi:hypothetical protein
VRPVRTSLFRATRLAAAVALVATPVAATGADAHAGAGVSMKVTFGGGRATVSVSATSTGGLGPAYVVDYYVAGAVTGTVTVPVADRQTAVVNAGAPTFTDSRSYPAPAGSTVVLTYGAQVVAASGVPAAYCAGAVWRQPNGTTVTAGSC